MGDYEYPPLGAGQTIALNAQGQAPGWVLLVPKGPMLKGADGRQWRMPDAAEVVAATMAPGNALPVDINHAQFIKAPKGEASPAVGWIEKLEARDGAIWGHVAWNAAGVAALAERAYRYISPVLKHTADGLVRALAGAGLTNRPNFTELPALCAAADEAEPSALFRKIMESCGHKGA
jgi:phage I-like protein